MKSCGDIRTRLTLYLDEELQHDELAIFEEHLKRCESCRSLVESERSFLNSVRGARPLNVAPADLRENVQRLVSELPTAPTAPASLKRKVERHLRKSEIAGPRLENRWAIVAAASVGLILILPVMIWWLSKYEANAPSNASNFALIAAENHLRHIRGQLPLEVVSAAPDEISAWFANKVKFGVKLPNYQELSGQEKVYTLEGARLIGYESDYAAYVAYRMGNNPISLVITSDEVARSSGGEEITAKGLVFHYNTIQGLKVITWSDRGLTYALVSDLEERGQQSCVVCHQGTRDRDFIEPLKPR